MRWGHGRRPATTATALGECGGSSGGCLTIQGWSGILSLLSVRVQDNSRVRTTSTMINPSGIAIDGSGDVWVSNNGNSTVSEFIGAATPVVTPLSVGVKNSTLGTRP